MPDNYVQSGRTFRELKKDKPVSDLPYFNLPFSTGASLSRDDLLQGHRTVILSEAGVAKPSANPPHQRNKFSGTPALILHPEHIVLTGQMPQTPARTLTGTGHKQ
ncbi:hypothetical protein [Acetobacter oeni]|nr:hypothetical protein [Acetobacter oeni]GBR02574.1 hypothetical protein AA21952_0799 [Acetobacter oeni LMG 21952]